MGGIKDMLSPPCQNMGGIYHPHPPQDLRPCPFGFNSTSSSIKKLKTSYNGALRRLLLIKNPYSVSAMFVTHGIPSFFELLRKCIFNFSQRISLSSNSIITACMTPTVFIHSPIRQWWRSVLF